MTIQEVGHRVCACVWKEPPEHNYSASFMLTPSTGAFTCNSCNGAIEPDRMPWDMRDDGKLLSMGVDLYAAKYALPRRSDGE